MYKMICRKNNVSNKQNESKPIDIGLKINDIKVVEENVVDFRNNILIEMGYKKVGDSYILENSDREIISSIKG